MAWPPIQPAARVASPLSYQPGGCPASPKFTPSSPFIRRSFASACRHRLACRLKSVTAPIGKTFVAKQVAPSQQRKRSTAAEIGWQLSRKKLQVLEEERKFI
ncbi:hypothetical protein [Pseudomonas oryzihabitans]|uniref:hypothetical protein n=1 Tax=Pseudomonas oryzihabitans TaxID=47885 RepID=UPI0030EE696C